MLAAASSTSLRAASVCEVTRSLCPPPLPTASHAVPAPPPTAPFALSALMPLIDPFPLVFIDETVEDDIECAVPKKKVRLLPSGRTFQEGSKNAHCCDLSPTSNATNGGCLAEAAPTSTTDFQGSQDRDQHAEDHPVREVRSALQVPSVPQPLCCDPGAQVQGFILSSSDSGFCVHPALGDVQVVDWYHRAVSQPCWLCSYPPQLPPSISSS